MTAIPKPETRRKAKARAKRQEQKVVGTVRERCADRDGHCRLAGVERFGHCEGPSTWAHLRGFTRAQTRGQAPERRHCTEGSLMLCRGHHQTGEFAYDLGRLDIEPQRPDKGANGPLTFIGRADGALYREVRGWRRPHP